MIGVAIRQRGFALLIVLWALIPLAVLGSQILATARVDARIARNLLESAELEAAANGAIQQAIYGVLDRTSRHWSSDGSIRVLSIGKVQVAVSIDNEADKVNPNVASAELMQALLIQVGADSAAAAEVAAAIVEWRLAGAGGNRPNPVLARYLAAGRSYAPSGAPFASIDELSSVLGMTSDLLAALRPHLTVFTEEGPGRATRDPVVMRALIAISRHDIDAERDAPANAEHGASALVAITVDARAKSQSRHVARAVVRTNARPEGRRYDVLAYDRLANEPLQQNMSIR